MACSSLTFREETGGPKASLVRSTSNKNSKEALDRIAAAVARPLAAHTQSSPMWLGGCRNGGGFRQPSGKCCVVRTGHDPPPARGIMAKS
jgi:hypothetical protein